MANKVIRKGLEALAVAGMLASSAQKADAAVYGFSTFSQAGQTNTINSGDLINLGIMQGTTNNVSTATYKIEMGAGNTLASNLQPISVDFYTDSNLNITNGFYNGRALNPTFSGLSNKGAYSEIGLTLTGGYATGTNSAATIQFQGFNNSPTNIIVPVNLGFVQVGRSGGTCSTSGGSWANTSHLYGNSSISYVEIFGVPEPSTLAMVGMGLAGIAAAGLRRKRSYNSKNLDEKIGRQLGRK